jgi:hypothetical protein
MVTLLETITYFLEDHLLTEMANLQPEDTGIEHTVNVVSKGGAKHGARVKISNVPGKWAHDDNFTLTVEHEPRVIGNCKIKKEHLDNIKDWVKLNHDHLHKVWNDPGIMRAHNVINGFRKI